MVFPPVPKEIKPVAHLLKIAEEHESRNIVVTYWARMAACRLALKILPPGKKPPEVSALLTSLLDWLEETKKANADNEGITSETTAQAIIEDYALQLFAHGDEQDRAEIYNKNTIKTFYTAGMLMDVLEQFGLSEEINDKRKYAKWKAAYIHNCLKTGDKPFPGAPGEHLNNVMHISELSDDEKAKFKAEMDKEQEDSAGENAASAGFSGVPSFPSIPKPDENTFSAPAPASSPVTPNIQPTPVPFSTPQPVTPSTPSVPLFPATSGLTLTPDQIQKAQKFCKFATSALNYDDVKTAIENLHKALNLLQTGNEA